MDTTRIPKRLISLTELELDALLRVAKRGSLKTGNRRLDNAYYAAHRKLHGAFLSMFSVTKKSPD